MKTVSKNESNIIPLKELRSHTEKYIKGVAEGATFVVMRRSRPIFRLIPVEDKWESVIDFREINSKGVSGKRILKHL